MEKCILYIVAGFGMFLTPGCYGGYGVITPHRVVYTSHLPQVEHRYVYRPYYRHYKQRVVYHNRHRSHVKRHRRLIRHRHIHKEETFIIER